MKAETRTALTMLANATNASIGQTAGSFLDGLVPQFEQLAKAYTLARTDPAAAARMLSTLADSNIDDLREEQLDLLEVVQPKPTKKRASK
jgi:hypothetical protein